MGQVLAAVAGAAASPAGQAVLSSPGPGNLSAPQLTPASAMLPGLPNGSQTPGLPDNNVQTNQSTPMMNVLLGSQDTAPKNPYSTDIPATLKQAGQPKNTSFMDEIGNAMLLASGYQPVLHRPQATISTRADVNVPTSSMVPGAAPNTAPAGQPNNKKGL